MLPGYPIPQTSFQVDARSISRKYRRRNVRGRVSQEILEEEIRSFVSKPSYDKGVWLGRPGGSSYPRITIVTPSYNQAEFLEKTILSVLNQNYPNLEYIIIDGGSSDGSVEIIRRYSDFLSYWVSEKDRGQSDAINKGFCRASGDLVAWQNSDDIYLPGALKEVARVFGEDPGHDVYYGNMYTIDQDDNILHEHRYTPFSVRSLLFDGWNLTNQSAFIRRDIARAYAFENSLEYAMDADFFVRLGSDERKFRFIHRHLGALRVHPAAKGETIGRFVGDEEWAGIRTRAGIVVRKNIPWGRQFRVRKAYYKLRKLLYYILQGDVDYVVSRIRRMFS